MDAKQIYTVMAVAADMGLISFDFEALCKRTLTDSHFLQVFDHKRDGISYIWAVADLLEERLENPVHAVVHQYPDYKVHQIVSVEKFVSKSGNVTWKAIDEDGAVIFLRQAQKELLEKAGILALLDTLSVGDEVELSAGAFLHTTEDGDYRKPVMIDGIWEFESVEFNPDDDDVRTLAGGDPLDELPDFSEAPEMPKNKLNAIQWADELVTKAEGDFVVLDTETTGLDGYPVQVAVISSSGAVLFDEFVKPPEGVTIHPKAQAVHGITLESLKDAPEWDALFDRFCEVVKDKRVVIYNASFDLGILRSAAKKYGSGLYPWKSAECAMEQYAEYNGDWNDYHGNYRWVALTEAARAMGVVVEDEHTAKGDCLMTLGVIKALAAKARSEKPVSKQAPF